MQAVEMGLVFGVIFAALVGYLAAPVRRTVKARR